MRVHLDAFVCMCVHVCAHLGAHVCVYVYAWVWMCVCIWVHCVFVYVHICVCMCVCMGVCVHAKHLVLDCLNGIAALEASNKIKPTPAF